MAYVKITGEFKQRVRDKIRRMKDQALDAYPVGLVTTNSEEHLAMCEIVHKSIWGAHMHLKDMMPANWLGELESGTIEFRGLRPEEEQGPHEYETNVSLRDTDFTKAPPKTNRWHNPTVQIMVEDCPHSLRKWLDGVLCNLVMRAQCESKFREIDRQIMSFLNKHVSLNTAIKELPELEMYIHSDDMERLHRKVHRAASSGTHEVDEQEDVNVDVGLLTSTAIASRMKR